MKNFLKQIFKDVDGHYSSKRFFVFISVSILIATWVGNFFYQMSITEFIFEGFLYIVIVGLGVTTAEKFSRKDMDAPVENVLKSEDIIK
jgi:hypothetical protein